MVALLEDQLQLISEERGEIGLSGLARSIKRQPQRTNVARLEARFLLQAETRRISKQLPRRTASFFVVSFVVLLCFFCPFFLRP